MTVPLPKDIEEGNAAHRAIYLRGYQDGYRASHEERSKVPQALMVERAGADILRRIGEIESQVRALQGNSADTARQLGEVRALAMRHLGNGGAK